VRLRVDDHIADARLLDTPAADAVWEALPLRVSVSVWGDEIYGDVGLDVGPPPGATDVAAVGDLAIFEDDKTYLTMRVERLETGMAWGEDPPSRTRHIVGNLVVDPQPDGEVQAKTAFLLYRSHHETEENLFSGYREDVLRPGEGGWKIARRTIVLDSNVILAKNLSVFF